jgi:hypothetical protein
MILHYEFMTKWFDVLMSKKLLQHSVAVLCTAMRTGTSGYRYLPKYRECQFKAVYYKIHQNLVTGFKSRAPLFQKDHNLTHLLVGPSLSHLFYHYF